MRVTVKITAITCLLMLAGAAAKAQKSELKINQALSPREAVSGQLMELKLEGLSDEMLRPIPIEKIEVQVRQNGATHKAKVRSSTMFMMLSRMIPKTPSTSEETASKVADDREQDNRMKAFQKKTAIQNGAFMMVWLWND